MKIWGGSLLCLALITVTQNLVFAENTPNDNELNDLLQGFDSPATEIKTDNIDDLMSGFEENIPTVNESTQILDEKKWDFTTLLSLSSSYNYQQAAPSSGDPDYRGLSRLKTKLQPEFRYKFSATWDTLINASIFYDAIYRINGRSQYTQATLNSNETEAEFREMYLRGTLTDNVDIKIGRQIVVWGKSDSIRVVDILNPLDFREPGMVDIEDLRLPVTMFKADYYFSNWNLSAIIIPEIRFNKMPAHGSNFSLSDFPSPHEEMPENLVDSEFALALNGVFSGWDLSFHAANYYDDQPHLVTQSGTPQGVELKHSRLNMLGAATNIAAGNWLFKMESAYIDGLEFNHSQASFSRIDVMFGLDYSGLTDTTLSVEIVNRHINNYASALSLSPDLTEKDEGQIALRYTGNFMREKLKLIALASILGTDFDSGAFYRGSVEYEIMDAMSIMFGGIVYQSGDNFLIKRIADNDRVFIDLRVSF